MTTTTRKEIRLKVADVIEVKAGGGEDALHRSLHALTLEAEPGTLQDHAFTISFTENNTLKMRDKPNGVSRLALQMTVRHAHRVFGQDIMDTLNEADDDADLIVRAVCSSVAEERSPLNITAISPGRQLTVPHTNREWFYMDTIINLEYQFSLAVP